MLLSSCIHQEKQQYISLLQEWQGRELRFPSDEAFSVFGRDTVDFSKEGMYKIVSYVDSSGCISCKLQLPVWKELIRQMDSLSVPVLFYMHPKSRKEMIYILKQHLFDYPVCIDEHDALNRLNHFPADMAFHTFLLDANNKVVAIGNPVHNPKVKELYLRIIRGEADGVRPEKETAVTSVEVDSRKMDMGSFPWREERKAVFVLHNTGEHPLAVHDVATSCGCTTVSYDKRPVWPGETLSMEVTYKATQPGFFNKTISVYCNAKPSLLKLHVSGVAEE